MKWRKVRRNGMDDLIKETNSERAGTLRQIFDLEHNKSIAYGLLEMQLSCFLKGLPEPESLYNMSKKLFRETFDDEWHDYVSPWSKQIGKRLILEAVIQGCDNKIEKLHEYRNELNSQLTQYYQCRMGV